jgi:uncharacterized membrane protein YedE/YeeE
MLKRLMVFCCLMSLILGLLASPARASTSEPSFLDRYAYNPFAVALAVAGAGISVATAANAVSAAATAVGTAAEVVVTGATVIGGATFGTMVVAGVGIGAVLFIGTSDLTELFESAQEAALAFQGR